MKSLTLKRILQTATLVLIAVVLSGLSMFWGVPPIAGAVAYDGESRSLLKTFAVEGEVQSRCLANRDLETDGLVCHTLTAFAKPMDYSSVDSSIKTLESLLDGDEDKLGFKMRLAVASLATLGDTCDDKLLKEFRKWYFGILDSATLGIDGFASMLNAIELADGVYLYEGAQVSIVGMRHERAGRKNHAAILRMRKTHFNSRVTGGNE